MVNFLCGALKTRQLFKVLVVLPPLEKFLRAPMTSFISIEIFFVCTCDITDAAANIRQVRFLRQKTKTVTGDGLTKLSFEYTQFYETQLCLKIR